MRARHPAMIKTVWQVVHGDTTHNFTVASWRSPEAAREAAEDYAQSVADHYGLEYYTTVDGDFVIQEQQT